MKDKKYLAAMLLAGFILSGGVSFAAFILTGMTYAIGSTDEVIVVFLAVLAGSYTFAFAGILLSRAGKYSGYLSLAAGIAVPLIIFVRLQLSPVMHLETMGLYSYAEMASSLPASWMAGYMASAVRGRRISLVHGFFIGSGSPVVFVALFLIYSLNGYADLPLVSLLAEIAAFSVSAAIIYACTVGYEGRVSSGSRA